METGSSKFLYKVIPITAFGACPSDIIQCYPMKFLSFTHLEAHLRQHFFSLSLSTRFNAYEVIKGTCSCTSYICPQLFKMPPLAHGLMDSCETAMDILCVRVCVGVSLAILGYFGIFIKVSMRALWPIFMKFSEFPAQIVMYNLKVMFPCAVTTLHFCNDLFVVRIYSSIKAILALSSQWYNSFFFTIYLSLFLLTLIFLIDPFFVDC